MIGRVALPIIALLIAAAGQAAASPRHTYLIPDQRRIIQGWHVSNAAEEDGGRLVRMTRTVGRYVLVYDISFWRANPGPLAQANVGLPDGDQCASDEWRRDPNSPNLWRPETNLAARSRAVRAVFTQGLAGCHIAPGRAAAALRGFDSAFALAAHYAELSRRSTIAENDWILRH
jgi:hypothetical protein